MLKKCYALKCQQESDVVVVACVRDLVDYEKKRAEERAAAAEQWRQKESARAKQVGAAESA